MKGSKKGAAMHRMPDGSMMHGKKHMGGKKPKGYKHGGMVGGKSHDCKPA